MRIALALVALLVPAVAVADDADDARAELLRGIATRDATAIRAVLAPGVEIQVHYFADRACDRRFGAGTVHKVSKRNLAKLARCIVREGWHHVVADLGVIVADVAGGKITAVNITVPEYGVEGDEGDEGGVVGGIAGGVVGAPPPPPPPPAAPQNVAPTAVESNRLSGDKNIVPDDDTKTEIQRVGKSKIVASYKMCLTSTGTVDKVVQLKSSGFPAYDAKLQAGIKSWTYRPFMVNGAAAPVCTAVTFVYSQK